MAIILGVEMCGWCHFQIDLGMALINHAIAQEWDYLEMSRPNWMHQKPFLSCEYKKCVFCLKILTKGISHQKQKTAIFVQHNDTCIKKKVALTSGST